MEGMQKKQVPNGDSKQYYLQTKKSTKLRKEAENGKRYSIREGYTNEKGWRKEMHSMLV